MAPIINTKDTSYPPPMKNPSFQVYRADGSKFPSLVKFFLVKQIITVEDLDKGYLELPDSSLWNLVLEAQVVEDLVAQGYSNAIISYQVHDYGNFAVARKDNGPRLTKEQLAKISYPLTIERDKDHELTK